MFKFIKKILDLQSTREKFQLYLLLVIQAFTAAIEIAGIASIMPFMAVVANQNVITTNRWLKQGYDYFAFTSLHGFLFFLGLLVLGLLIFSNMLKTLNTWLSLKYDNHLYYMLAHRLLASYLARPYEFFLNRNTAEMGKNVLAEARTVVAGIINPGMQVLSGSLMSLLIIALLLAVNPFTAVVIFGVLGACYVTIYFTINRRLTGIGEDQFKANAMKFKVANEALAGIKDLKVMGRERVFLERFEVHALRHAHSNTMSGLISELPRYTLETVAFSGILLLVLVNLRSEQTIGNMIPLLALYAFAGYRLLPALQQVYSGTSKVRVNLPSLDILHRDMREGYVDAAMNDTKTETMKLEPLPLLHELALKNVTFRYPGVKKPTIKNASLSIARNSSVGIVGPTGSGKTTLVDIILGLLNPTSGIVEVDGRKITSENIPCWKLNLGYVPQRIFLCDDTIINNIAFGVPEKDIDMSAVIRASRIANLHGFIQRELPNGYETVIGEQGIRLSGGQRQRIGVARALYHDPAVLIMDEATSALDGITEEAVMDALRTLSGEKTVITIAHRLTTLKDCDVIYLMEQGIITWEGTYDELQTPSSRFHADEKKKAGAPEGGMRSSLALSHFE